MIPVELFEIGIFSAYAGIASGTLYLAVMLLREWRRGELW